ncbi:hypothetical protein AB0G83_22885 [Streptomyces klenkii]
MPAITGNSSGLDGPLTEFFRTDGAHAENCFTPMLDNLRRQNLPVPV